MKICILTQPLGHNYGGIMQNYALQKVLKEMGHDVWTEDRKPNKNFLSKIKKVYFVRLLFGKKKISTPSLTEKAIIEQNLRQFIKENIQTTIPIHSSNKIKLLKYNFDAYLVGSDQVWRPCYSYNLYNYFLDFTKGLHVKRMAYAASFGVDNWEFTDEQTKKCKKLAKQFDYVSVREDSGIELCKSHLGIDAIHVLDPTLLLEKEEYISIINKKIINKKDNSLMVYVLDKTTDKENIIQKISEHLGLKINSVLPKQLHSNRLQEKIEACILPPVIEWIKGFMDADFVVTDSFHGTIFSIIFNKPFISIGNKSRGLSRFTSLLKNFGLENRLILSSDDLTKELIEAPIDFKKVNIIKEQQKQIAIKFLTKI